MYSRRSLLALSKRSTDLTSSFGMRFTPCQWLCAIPSYVQAALSESSRKSRDEKIHEIFDRFDEDYDMVLNAVEYGNLLATVDPECDGRDVEEIQDLAAEDFERYTDAITDEGLTEVGLRMLVDYKSIDVDKAYLNLLVRQSEKADDELLGL